MTGQNKPTQDTTCRSDECGRKQGRQDRTSHDWPLGANATLALPPEGSARPDLTTFKTTQEKPLAQRRHSASLEHHRPEAKLCFATRYGFRRHPCRCLWRGSAHTTKTTPRRLTILHLSQMRRTLARTFILAIVATVAYAFNGNEETDGKPSTIETFPPDPQGGGFETAGNGQKKLVRPANASQPTEKRRPRKPLKFTPHQTTAPTPPLQGVS